LIEIWKTLKENPSQLKRWYSEIWEMYSKLGKLEAYEKNSSKLQRVAKWRRSAFSLTVSNNDSDENNVDLQLLEKVIPCWIVKGIYSKTGEILDTQGWEARMGL